MVAAAEKVAVDIIIINRTYDLLPTAIAAFYWYTVKHSRIYVCTSTHPKIRAEGNDILKAIC